MFRSPLFAWSPRPDQDPESQGTPASQFSRFRTMMNGSSIYSQSPVLPNQTPKSPFLGFLRRDQSPNPNHAQHSASSYIGVIPSNTSQPPHELHNIQANGDRRPSLPRQDSNSSVMDPDIQRLQEEISGDGRRQRRRKHRRNDHHDQWVRKRKDRGTMLPFIKGSAARGKMVACMISGTFMLLVLTIYLAIALTQVVGQEIHILFIFILLSTTIFFSHSLIRLCMLILHPRTSPSRNPSSSQPTMPNPTAPEGFQPIIPIRVHLARDEELGIPSSDANDMVDPIDPEKDVLPPPPPAYGLWRSSVRANPNLLHWQRVEEDERSNRAYSAVSSRRAYSVVSSHRAGSVSSAAGSASVVASYAAGRAGNNEVFEPENEGPRPPSYASEDGVSYISEQVMGSSDIHPAWRPGYAISEIRPGELPRR